MLTGEQNILVQCKHTASDHEQSEMSVREVFSARPLYEEAMGKSFPRLVVISNASSYSRKVKKTAKSYDVELIDYGNIKKLLRKHPVSKKSVLEKLGKQRIEIH